MVAARILAWQQDVILGLVALRTFLEGCLFLTGVERCGEAIGGVHLTHLPVTFQLTHPTTANLPVEKLLVRSHEGFRFCSRPIHLDWPVRYPNDNTTIEQLSAIAPEGGEAARPIRKRIISHISDRHKISERNTHSLV